jgi:VIT1/CCC1 family predicted Fe2+/Mn2+ transporter
VLGIIAAGASAALTSLQIFATGLGGAAAGALSVFAAMYLSQTTEKKTRLLAAWESSRKITVKRARGANGGNAQLREPTKKEHKMFHELVSRIHRRALLSGLVTSATSTMASLALLLPLVMLAPIYDPSTTTAISILIGIFLLSLMGAFRGMTLKQSRAKSAIKMVILGIVIIIASRMLGSYVQTLLK